MSSSLTASAPKDQQLSPVAQRRRLLPYKETIGGSSPSRTTEETQRLDTPTGRATRLKPECLRVRILLWALNYKTWLGRQLADHFGLEPEMLRVRIPPELLATKQLRPRGAAECSPACHAGDRGFKSHRGRLLGTVRKLVKRRSSNLRDRL